MNQDIRQQVENDIINLIDNAITNHAIVVDEGMSHLDVARAYVSSRFSGKMVLDIRTQAQPKHEWASGGTRNPYGSTKKFNDSRSKLTWVSSYTFTDEDGKQRTETETKNIGRNLLKRTARRLGKLNGLGYGKSKRLLEAHIAQLEREDEDG